MIDRRAVKKYELSHVSPLYVAYNLGEDAGCCGRAKRNPYPAGKRHTEYERGYRLGLFEREERRLYPHRY